MRVKTTEHYQHYQISLTVLVIGYALGKIAMLFS